MNCKYCNKEYNNKRSLSQHELRCIKNPNHKDIWNKGLNISNASVLKGTLKRQQSLLEGKWTYSHCKHTEETKRILSEKRKLWLSTHINEHPWKSNTKYISAPCEKLKEFLRTKNINFIEEYNPKIKDHFYSLDIASPDINVAIEVNGEQHYNRDGTLKNYYLNRHNVLEQNGWKIFELHYSKCFNLDISTLDDILKLDIYDKNYVNKYFSYKEEIKLKKQEKLENKQKQKQKRLKEKELLYNQRRKIFLDLLNNSNINFKKYGWVNKSLLYLKEQGNLYFKANIRREIKKYIPDYIDSFYYRPN